MHVKMKREEEEERDDWPRKGFFFYGLRISPCTPVYLHSFMHRSMQSLIHIVIDARADRHIFALVFVLWGEG